MSETHQHHQAPPMVTALRRAIRNNPEVKKAAIDAGILVGAGTALATLSHPRVRRKISEGLYRVMRPRKAAKMFRGRDIMRRQLLIARGAEITVTPGKRSIFPWLRTPADISIKRRPKGAFPKWLAERNKKYWRAPLSKTEGGRVRRLEGTSKIVEGAAPAHSWPTGRIKRREARDAFLLKEFRRGYWKERKAEIRGKIKTVVPKVVPFDKQMFTGHEVRTGTFPSPGTGKMARKVAPRVRKPKVPRSPRPVRAPRTPNPPPKPPTDSAGATVVNPQPAPLPPTMSAERAERIARDNRNIAANKKMVKVTEAQRRARKAAAAAKRAERRARAAEERGE